jgi:putative aldouronate transport system permease protein
VERELVMVELAGVSAQARRRSRAGRGRGSLGARIVRYRYLLLLLLPAMIYFVVFRYIPIYGVLLAFKDFDVNAGILRSPWVGLKHFERFFGINRITMAWWNTIRIATLKILFGFPAPIILALLLNEVRSVGYKKTIQTISYLPHFLSWVTVAGLMTEILSPSRGPVGVVIRALGGIPPMFLMSKTLFVPILIVSDIWKGVGWGSIIYLATIASINPELYEAAVMDGAGKFRQALHVTIPGIIPVITLLAILQVGGILDSGFDQIFNLINPSVYDVATTLDIFVYWAGIVGFEYSFATAVGLSRSLIAFVLILTANMLARRFSDYALW